MSRRKPTRAGILNVWEYDSQTFSFGDGRLALRGRNGSGKSNALSLLFPFVFDGVMSAQRLDPMGGARSMRASATCGWSSMAGAARARRLVDLLLVLRRLHLAGKLDPDSVSATLSAGLQSLDANLVADVTRSFDDLELTQQELHDLQTSLDVVERFLPLYVEHLVHHVRRRAEDLVGTNRNLRDLRRRRSDAESAKDAAGDRPAELIAAIDDLERAIAADETEVEAILASGAYQAIGMLDEVGKQVHAATESAAAADARAQAVQARHVAAEAELRVHADFDIGGLRIAGAVIART